MSKNKELKRSLKGPDAFQTTVATGMDRALRYKALIIVALVGVVLATIGIAGYDYYQAQRRQSRISELGKIEQAYKKETEAVSEGRNKVREELGKLTEPNEDGSAPKLSAAQEKRKQELTDRITTMLPDHTGTLPRYLQYYETYKSYPEGWMAGTRAVGILIDQKKFAEAKPVIKEIIATADDSMFYQIHGRLMYINLLDELDELDEGLKEVAVLQQTIDRLDAMAKEAEADEKNAINYTNPVKELRPQVLLTKGRLELRQGNKDAAGKTFDNLIKEYENSAEARQAISYKALLL